MIMIADEKERIDAFLPLLDEVMGGGAAILEPTLIRD
jgi:PII-like signaling protein